MKQSNWNEFAAGLDVFQRIMWRSKWARCYEKIDVNSKLKNYLTKEGRQHSNISFLVTFEIKSETEYVPELDVRPCRASEETR